MYLEIALDTPLRRVFDYRCPADVRVSGLRRGLRVRVPFGRRRLVGILVNVKSVTTLPAEKLRTAIEILDTEPILDDVLFDLLMWSAEYYRHPVGEVLAAALPVAIKSGGAVSELIEQWRLTSTGESQWESLPKNAKRLRGLMDAAARQAGEEEFAKVTPTWRAGLKELESRGWLASATTERAPVERNDRIIASRHTLGADQAKALAEIVAATDRFRTLLLHGVTGSGKTEVYLRAIETVVAAGKQALVLVPEIALTPQLVSRFQARFTAPLAVLHSGLSDSERLKAWRQARDGSAPIVVGTRSAIFAPLKSPGIIIVDEEHDPSFKQQEGFRYSARDLAIVRAQRHNIPIVLGSATPSLESLARAHRQAQGIITLPERAGSAQLPILKLIDLRAQAHTDGIAAASIRAIDHHLRNDAQVLLYLNRRGFAPVLFCPGCGWSAACSRCDARMTLHKRENRLKCHHCGHENSIPLHCPSCNAETKPVGQGTERIEETMGRLFPGVALARIDRDSIRRKGDLEKTLEQIQSNTVRILVGTQMLTKGHDFPNVTLVIVLNADQGLFGTDFRSSERLAQSIVQVAGRAGRAERAGEVLIQTEFPEHPLLARLLSGGYPAFAEAALAEREQAAWPPFARLALLRAEGTSMAAAMTFLREAAGRAQAQAGSAVEILGPVAAPMQRKAGHYRGQLLLRATSHTPLQNLLARWMPQLESSPSAKRIRWAIDVDPLDLF